MIRAADHIVTLGKGHAITHLLDFSAETSIDLDASALMAKYNIPIIKAVYLDNADNLLPLTMNVVGAKQRLIFPPQTQSYRNLLGNVTQRFTFSVASTFSALVPVFLLNFDEWPEDWNIFGGEVVTISGTVTVTELATLGTSASGTITAGGAAQLVMAANSARHEMYLYNPSALTESLWISYENTSPAPNAGGSIEIPPGSGWAGNFTNALYVYGATTGHTFTAGQR